MECLPEGGANNHYYKETSMKSPKIAFFSLLLACLMNGCTSGHFVPSSQHSENNTTIIRDTFLLHDSVFIDRYQNVYIKGDTVVVERTKTVYKERWRTRTQTDTFLVEKCDTIMVPHEVEKVNNVVPKWIGWSLLFNCMVIVFCIWRIWKRWKH